MKSKIFKQKGTGMPILGLGTWRLVGQECERAVENALKLGYRHIDTADAYHNHQAIGKVIQSWPREELFLTSKITPDNLMPSHVKKCIPRFLDELNTAYLDLLLIHWPNPDVDMAKSLKAMMEFKDKGLVREIGVSNFGRPNFEALKPHQFPILTNQIEMHPYLQRKQLVVYCREHGIGVTAYRPLAKGAFEKDAVLQSIGEKYGKGPSQIALRWLIQQDIVAIPKASSVEHLQANSDIFDFALTQGEMKQIEQLDAGKSYLRS